MKTIYTALPLAVLAAVAQSQDHGHSGVHDFLGDNNEKGDFLGDGFNKPHDKPEEEGFSAGALNVPRDGAPDFDVPSFSGPDNHNAPTDINSPEFNSPTISPDINSPVSGPHNFNAQKGPHTNSGDNKVDGGINNDNIVITPVDGFQGQAASEQDNYIAPPPPPPPVPHGGPPHEEGGEHGPEQLPPGQHSEPQQQAPAPPAEHPHPEGGPPAPGPEDHAPPAPKEEKPEAAPAPAPAPPAQAPPAPQGPPQQAPEEPVHPDEHQAAPPAEHPVREYPAQSEEEHPHPGRQGEQETPCTFHNHETPYPQARPQPSSFQAKPTPEAKAAPAPAPQPEFNQGSPKPLGFTPGFQQGEGAPAPAKAHMSHAAHSSAACSSARVHNVKPSSEALPRISFHVEAHSSFVVAKPSHTPSTTPASRVAATHAPHPSSSGTTSAFVGGAGSVSVPQGFGMAVAGALAFLL